MALKPPPAAAQPIATRYLCAEQESTALFAFHLQATQTEAMLQPRHRRLPIPISAARGSAGGGYGRPQELPFRSGEAQLPRARFHPSIGKPPPRPLHPPFVRRTTRSAPHVPAQPRAPSHPRVPCTRSRKRLRQIPCTSFPSSIASRANPLRSRPNLRRPKLVQEHRPRPVQPRPHGAHGALQQRRRLTVTLALQIAQRDRFAIMVWKGQNGVAQKLADLIALQPFVDRFWRSHHCGGMPISVGLPGMIGTVSRKAAA